MGGPPQSMEEGLSPLSAKATDFKETEKGTNGLPVQVQEETMNSSADEMPSPQQPGMYDHVPSATNQDPDEETPTVAVTVQAVPKNEDMTELLTEQLEKQIQEEVEAQLSNDRQNIVHAEPIKSSISIVKSNGGESDSSKVCGISRRNLPFVLVMILLVILGGIIAGIVVASKPGNESVIETTDNSQDTANQSVLRQQLERWIIRTDDDRRPFDDSESPQSLALQWLSTDDYTARLLSDTNSTKEILERYALAVFYYSTDGPNWKQKDFPFLTSSGICDWQNGKDWSLDSGRGVYCSGSTVSSLHSISLRNNGLVGTIPWELSLLTGLEYVFLNDNALQGPIPVEISKLTSLKTLVLSWNALTGSLPEELPPSLTVLDVDSNSLTGTIPSAWGKNSPNLGQINLQSNLLSGPLPAEISNLQALEILWVPDNDFTGTIPTEFGLFSAMQFLLVGMSSLNGTIPTELGNLADLKILVIRKSNISGRIPTEFGKLTSLVELDLRYNDLTGGVPREMGQLPNLTSFSFSHNDLIGSVEDILCQSSTQWIQLASDCLGTSAIGEGEIDCSCCTLCCSADGDSCKSLMPTAD